MRNMKLKMSSNAALSVTMFSTYNLGNLTRSKQALYALQEQVLSIIPLKVVVCGHVSLAAALVGSPAHRAAGECTSSVCYTALVVVAIVISP